MGFYEQAELRLELFVGGAVGEPRLGQSWSLHDMSTEGGSPGFVRYEARTV